MIKDLILTLIVASALATVSEARAENNWQEEYLSEEVTVIVAYDKPFPERTAFKCKKGNLWKWGNQIRDYKGNPVECTLEKMTRGEYEVRNNISRVF